jgi:hypothetical protein
MILGGLLEAVYRKMHDEIVDGVATAGATTTVTDTTIITKYTDAKFKSWVFFDSNTNQYSVVTGNINSTGVITFAPAIATAVQVGDAYSIVKGTIPLNTLIKLCNDGLTMIGKIWTIDTSLVTAASTRDYTMPLAMKGEDLRSVYLRDVNKYRFDAPNYDILPGGGGTATATLEFKSQPLVGAIGTNDYHIIINYMANHPALSVYNSAIDPTFEDNLVILACLEQAYYWKAHPKRKKIDMDNWVEARTLFEEALRLKPIQKAPKINQRTPINMYNDLWRK